MVCGFLETGRCFFVVECVCPDQAAREPGLGLRVFGAYWAVVGSEVEIIILLGLVFAGHGVGFG